MSADNYYIIRKHPFGGFAAVMGFASDTDEDDLQVMPDATELDMRFVTVTSAVSYALGEYSEYGVSVHPECQSEETEVAFREASRLLETANKELSRLYAVEYELKGFALKLLEKYPSISFELQRILGM
jgi:hypothetical protein